MLGKAVLSEKKEDNVMAAEWGKNRWSYLKRAKKLRNVFLKNIKQWFLHEKNNQDVKVIIFISHDEAYIIFAEKRKYKIFIKYQVKTL